MIKLIVITLFVLLGICLGLKGKKYKSNKPSRGKVKLDYVDHFQLWKEVGGKEWE